MKYTIIRADRAASEQVAGTVVYDATGYDYGCSSDDTRETGIQHVSVTLNENGDYPFFTIPREDLQAVG